MYVCIILCVSVHGLCVRVRNTMYVYLSSNVCVHVNEQVFICTMAIIFFTCCNYVIKIAIAITSHA